MESGIRKSELDKARDDIVVSYGWHNTYGWLRRCEMDNVYGYCYEDPDGDLIYTRDRRHKSRAYLQCNRDRETGEKYLIFALCAVPRMRGAK
jgi:hypothetical protein